MKKGDRVRYIGDNIKTLKGKVGEVTTISPASQTPIVVKFDHDGRRRVIDLSNVELEGKSMSIKSFIASVAGPVVNFAAPNRLTNPKTLAVYRYGLAAELASKATSVKKDAEKNLVDLGLVAADKVYPVGSTELLDSDVVRLTAETSAPSSRIDATSLDLALRDENLSSAMIRRILAAATTETKAAVKLVVVEK
jgi:hypothetical protein